MEKPAPAVESKSLSREMAGRGSYVQTNADGHGGSCIRRRRRENTSAQRCVLIVKSSLRSVEAGSRSIAATIAISKTGFGGMRMEFRKIKNSIQKFGYVEPVIVNFDMTIIGGHQRVTVLSDLEYTEIDCIVIDIDKNKEKALNIALNKITGEWNKELLADWIKDLQDSDFDVAFTGFEPPEIEQLFNHRRVDSPMLAS